MERIDIHPTRTYKTFKLRRGKPFPFGATLKPGGVNFSIFSSHATSCTLVLFTKGDPEPLVEIPFPEEFRIGNVYCMMVFDLDYENIEYGYRMDGPHDTTEGHWFDPSKILMDPYAKVIGGRDFWGEMPNFKDIYQHRARIVIDDFDWENDRPLELPPEDLVIYEMHLRSFTQHRSSGVKEKYRGTFAGMREKIEYFKALGVNAVELMPIFEFDEFENHRFNPHTGERLYNYWGYSTVGFFAPKAGYAATGKLGMQVDELKALVKELHKNGIEVILDVVFNHTAEGNELGQMISFRGIDNKVYYMLTPEGYYFNFSGCGNTLNCNHPIVRNIVLDCLRYWASEYHIDGFRFDLASILGRDRDGTPLTNPPLLEVLAFDPILAKCKLIAEAWDAGGLYQVGSFPSFGRWAEWNGKYRDMLRQFVKGDAEVWEMSHRLMGSPDLYAETNRPPTTSINFITAHDGFTLIDLFSYEEKHNEANGEGNRDGANDNFSWNCGEEGLTDDPEINELRRRLVKNAIALLMVSQGVPMILMGDEMGRTKQGNNNTYCHDNELNWLDWSLLETNQDIFEFFQHCIAFRHAHPVLRRSTHFRHQDIVGSGYADISWHGTQAWNVDWADYARTLGFLLCGQHAQDGQREDDYIDDYIYVGMNMHWEPLTFEIPQLPDEKQWHLFADTGLTSVQKSWKPGTEMVLENQFEQELGDRSVLILVGR
ncbi:MAG: glycogen debranching protein GlgX [Roseofilum sp. SBFL]|uniref:glycogen debranching protein GlgX n=1 Tax=unclassified Roseofilum TaxID=2620099 RepID=UPI001B15AF00|nr:MULTISPECIES: glycogen debranching protein GlgX [unclassified Roseofilum]MBP0038125.1 glycogen debranching protein GlgX [Roseofilum sp. SID1]MBP0044326.1 glycogen debranching protein GlgX [Roseofilum sp. SBFL]